MIIFLSIYITDLYIYFYVISLLVRRFLSEFIKNTSSINQGCSFSRGKQENVDDTSLPPVEA